MTRSIALLRGINVGGRNKLPMKDLRALIESLGGENVRTYIQSGNIVFDGDIAADTISAAIEKKYNFCPHVFVLSANEMKKAAFKCPFTKEAERIPKSVHLFFLAAAAPNDVTAKFDNIKTSAERFEIDGKVMYLHSPKGLSESKIAEKADRILQTTTTARNWNTVRAVMDLAEKGE